MAGSGSARRWLEGSSPVTRPLANGVGDPSVPRGLETLPALQCRLAASRPPASRAPSAGQVGCARPASTSCATQASAAHWTIVKAVSSTWQLLEPQQVSSGAAAALSQPRAGPDWLGAPFSAVRIDPAFVDDPGNAAGQGDENHADDAEYSCVVLG